MALSPVKPVAIPVAGAKAPANSTYYGKATGGKLAPRPAANPPANYGPGGGRNGPFLPAAKGVNWGALTALAAYLKSQQGADPAAAAAAGGGSGGGFGGGGAAAAAVDPLQLVHDQSMGDLNSISAQQAQRLAALQSQQTQQGAATSAGIQQDLASQLQAYHTATDPISHDLTAQGFTAAPAQQQQALDVQRLQDYATRQGDLSKRMDQVQQGAFADRSATNDQTSASYKALLDSNLMQAQIAAATAAASGGGHGRSGGGGGGSGAGGTPTAGDASLLADSNPTSSPDFLGYLQSSYGGGNKGQKAVANFAKTVNPDLSNVGPAWAKFKQMVLAQRAAGKKVGFSLNGIQKSVINPLIKNIGQARTAQAKLSRSSNAANARGYPVGG